MCAADLCSIHRQFHVNYCLYAWRETAITVPTLDTILWNGISSSINLKKKKKKRKKRTR